MNFQVLANALWLWYTCSSCNIFDILTNGRFTLIRWQELHLQSKEEQNYYTHSIHVKPGKVIHPHSCIRKQQLHILWLVQTILAGANTIKVQVLQKQLQAAGKMQRVEHMHVHALCQVYSTVPFWSCPLILYTVI